MDGWRLCLQTIVSFLRADHLPTRWEPNSLYHWLTSRIRTIQTSSGWSVSAGPEPFWVNTAAAAAVGAGHFHFGRASMARVGVMKLKVPPWRIGNLWVGEVEVLKVRGRPGDYICVFLMVSKAPSVHLWDFPTPPEFIGQNSDSEQSLAVSMWKESPEFLIEQRAKKGTEHFFLVNQCKVSWLATGQRHASGVTLCADWPALNVRVGQSVTFVLLKPVCRHFLKCFFSSSKQMWRMSLVIFEKKEKKINSDALFYIVHVS